MEQDFDLRVAKLEQTMEKLEAKIKQAKAETDAKINHLFVNISELEAKITEYIKAPAHLKPILSNEAQRVTYRM